MFKPEDVQGFTNAMLGTGLHAKRLSSLTRAPEGVLKSGSLGVTAIGHGLAAVHHLDQKHAVKQVDRLLSNQGLDVDALAPAWLSYVVVDTKELVVNMDWTEFDECDHSMLVLALQTGKGRSTPLLWLTTVKSQFLGERVMDRPIGCPPSWPPPSVGPSLRRWVQERPPWRGLRLVAGKIWELFGYRASDGSETSTTVYKVQEAFNNVTLPDENVYRDAILRGLGLE